MAMSGTFETGVGKKEVSEQESLLTLPLNSSVSRDSVPCPLSCPANPTACQKLINQSHSSADWGIIIVAVLFHKMKKVIYEYE